MKRFVFFFILLLPLALQLNARDDLTVIVLGSIGGHHSEYYSPADIPEAYYNSDDQNIIIVADGFASYYDVDIVSESTLMPVISTQVDGYRDSIDISSLPDDDYTIVITSEYNNVFEGQFTNY